MAENKYYTIFGRRLTLTVEMSNYIEIENRIIDMLPSMAKLFLEYCGKNIKSADDAIANVLTAYVSVVKAYSEKINSLYVDCHVYDMSVKNIQEDIVKNGEFAKAYNQYEDTYKSIIDAGERQKRIRELNKQNRGRWIGGGFGLKGALTGAMTAGALNAVGGLLYGAANSVGNFVTDINISSNLEKFYSPETIEAFESILIKDVYLYKYNFIKMVNSKNVDVRIFYPQNKDIDSAENILHNVANGNINESKKSNFYMKHLI